MALFEAMAQLALEPLLRNKNSSGSARADATDNPLGDGLEAAAPALQKALARASEQSWQVLEVLLAGPAFWQACHLYLGAREWQELSQQAQALRERFQVRFGSTTGDEFRRQCLRELRRARDKGLLTAPAAPVAALAGRRRGSGSAVATADAAVPGLLRELRQVELTGLARLVELERQAEPLLARAMQHFFRRELEQDPALMPGVVLKALGGPGGKQQKTFQTMAQVMSRYGRGLQEWIEEDMSDTPVSAPADNPTTATVPDDKTRSETATVKDSATASARNRGGQPAQPAGQESVSPEESARQRRLGWIVALCGLLIPIVLVMWLFVRHMAHEVRVFAGPEWLVTCVAFSPAGDLVAAGSGDGSVHVWDRHTGDLLYKLNTKAGEVFAVGFSPDGKTLLTADLGDARLWDARTGEKKVRLSSERNYVICAVYSPAGQYIATSSKAEGKPKMPEGKIHLWDPKTGKEVRVLSGYKGPVRSLAFSPDGATLLGADSDVLWLWDVDSGKKLDDMNKALSEFGSGIACAAFAPDGKRIAFAGFDKTIFLYDLDEKKLVRTFEGHKSPVLSVAFSPDGRYLVSGSMGTKKSEQEKDSAMPDETRTVRVWSIASGQECYHFENVKEPVWSVAFAPDGGHVLTGGDGKNAKARLWSLGVWWLP